MNTLILVKHSLPEMAPAIPARQWRLSLSGQVRCMALAEKLESYLPDIVVSSVEPKAVETAQIVAGHLHKPFHTFEGLHEQDRTGVGFVSMEEFESQVCDLFNQPDRLVLGRETANQARARFSKALTSVEMKYPHKNIVVVAHGTVITLFVEKFATLDPFFFWKRLDTPSFVVLSLPEHTLVTTVETVV